jgi:thiol-disulfide isomerase/thioredoxin
MEPGTAFPLELLPMNPNPCEPLRPARRLRALLAAGLMAPVLALAGSIAELKPVSPTPAPTLTERPGGPDVLESLRGRPVLVNFWATWCEPCRDEMPALDRLRERRPDVAVITVAMADSKVKVETFAKDYLLDLRIIQDPDQVAGRAWGVRVLPTTLLLDAAHNIRYRAAGALDWQAPALEAALNSLKAGKPSQGNAGPPQVSLSPLGGGSGAAVSWGR